MCVTDEHSKIPVCAYLRLLELSLDILARIEQKPPPLIEHCYSGQVPSFSWHASASSKEDNLYHREFTLPTSEFSRYELRGSGSFREQDLLGYLMNLHV